MLNQQSRQFPRADSDKGRTLVIYKAVSPAELQAGDVVRRGGQLFTVAKVAASSNLGSYSVTFKEGLTLRLAGAVTVVDARWIDAPLALKR